ncbi:MAG: 4Fe-4S binding protein [Verrucomicrobia bacterium]|nr:4Fe-4S binding protein [Verrucomicrobiota bacterium]MBU4247641.1 4Fe-4S binding protein [Verrucomicrobiota bacterium]MCG2680910.1 4Fe-4S binding protein [Kiritimatiellia bacterium]
MLNILTARFHQKYRTTSYPRREPELPDRFQGCPCRDAARCVAGCRACAEVCPTDAIVQAGGGWRMDLGRCLFCGECSRACPHGALTFTREYRLATGLRQGLETDGAQSLPAVQALETAMRRLFGRSLKFRFPDPGGK